ncbi:MAG TPA: hypothetical protein VF491_04820, partial [Vicinamibacterales bacterium]
MTSFERWNRRTMIGVVALGLGALTCLALASASGRRVGLTVIAAAIAGAASPSVAAAQESGTTIRPFRVE